MDKLIYFIRKKILPKFISDQKLFMNFFLGVCGMWLDKDELLIYSFN